MTKERKSPFLYGLHKLPNEHGEGIRDFLFRRVTGSAKFRDGSSIWAMFMDVEDPSPESVLVFVRVDRPHSVEREEVIHEVNKRLTYLRSQIEPIFEGDGSEPR